jgi:hypothetical protein
LAVPPGPIVDRYPEYPVTCGDNAFVIDNHSARRHRIALPVLMRAYIGELQSV